MGFLLGIGGLTAPVRSAPIVFSSALTTSADANILSSGVLIQANTMNSASVVVNSVAFTTAGLSFTNKPAGSTTTVGNFDFFGVTTAFPTTFTTTSTPFTNLTYKSLVVGGIYNSATGTSSSITVTLNNLTVDNQYAVQFWVGDPRSFGANRTETVTGGGGNSVSLDFNSTEAAGGLGQYTTGTFTADSTSQSFTISGGPLGNSTPQINAIQLRDVSAVSTPEPGSVTSLLLVGSGLVFKRRRRSTTR